MTWLPPLPIWLLALQLQQLLPYTRSNVWLSPSQQNESCLLVLELPFKGTERPQLREEKLRVNESIAALIYPREHRVTQIVSKSPM